MLENSSEVFKTEKLGLEIYFTSNCICWAMILQESVKKKKLIYWIHKIES